MLKKLKEKEGMSSHEKKAKMDVLSHLRDMAQEAMGSKLDGLKKVSVMSDSSEGLEKGLDKAKEVLEHSEHEMEESPEEEASESPEEEVSEGEESEDEEMEMSPEEIDMKISELMALKQQLKNERE